MAELDTDKFFDRYGNRESIDNKIIQLAEQIYIHSSSTKDGYLTPEDCIKMAEKFMVAANEYRDRQ